jgi:hypothetical protein
MAIGFRIGNQYWEAGSPNLLHAFFSTISSHLEPEGWGTRLPVMMNQLYAGALPASAAAEVRRELAQAREALRRLPPSAVVWDIENPEACPPWGDDISPHITDLSNYFVTSDGRDLFEVLDEAVSALEGSQLILRVE